MCVHCTKKLQLNILKVCLISNMNPVILVNKCILLFVWESFQGKKDLVAVDSAEYDGDIGDLRDSDDENTHDGIQDHSSSDMDSDEERKK